MTYNWQKPDWPVFRYSLSEMEDVLHQISANSGRMSGLLEGLSTDIQVETIIKTMVSEALKTSEIEGEYLDHDMVMSSIRNNLGLNAVHELVTDKRALGVGEMMVSVRNHYHEELTEQMLFSWHEMIMRGNKYIKGGCWREHAEPMQIVSGPIGKQKVHFEAPPSEMVPEEMARFINWFNETAPGGHNEIKVAAVRAAIAHIYFESIHPFEDGNGRIGRAISEKALSQTQGRPAILSISKTIQDNRHDYYDALKDAQRSNEITNWIDYFVNVISAAQIEAEQQVSFALQKSKYMEAYKTLFNERQLRAVSRILKDGPEALEKGLSAKRYMAITNTSKATATRDLQDLLQKQAIKIQGAGRSTKYQLNLDGI